MDKEQTAIDRLRLASQMSLKIYKQPLVVTTSGGKDSSVCVALAQRAGVPFEVMHSHTTADAPETVYFVRSELERFERDGIKCTVVKPIYKGKRTSMWALIPQKRMPPTRVVRYCCDVLKETAGAGRFVVTGVRWAESSQRSNSRGTYEVQHRESSRRIVLNNDNDERRREFETCYLRRKRVCNPIIDWTDQDVWDYINSEHIPVNPMYSCGFHRIGCIGCPMAGKHRRREFARYPVFQRNYIRVFDRMLEARRHDGLSCDTWGSGEDVFHWWMEDGVLPGQISFDDLEEDL